MGGRPTAQAPRVRLPHVGKCDYCSEAGHIFRNCAKRKADKASKNDSARGQGNEGKGR